MRTTKQNAKAESLYFDAVADRRAFDEFSEEQYAEVLSSMLSRVSLGGRILDAGCGSGAWLAALRRGGWDAVGVELAPSQVERARALGLNAIVGDLLNLPSDLGTFDGVILCGVLHHFPNSEERTRVIRNVAETLNPGGVLASLDPNGSNPFVRLAFHLHSEVSPNERCLRETELTAAYLAAGRGVSQVRKLSIEQPRSPEGPLQALWPWLRRAALRVSGALGGAAVGNYTIVESLQKGQTTGQT
jgi:SAM-dependent methyltransferase